MNETTIKQVSPILVCAQRRTIAKADFDAELEMMWPAVNRHIEGAGGKAVIPCMMCYHSGTWDYAGDTLDIEVIEPLAATIPAADAEGIAVYTLPAEAQMACIVHKGPFATIGKTYAALMDWVKQNGYHATGALREIYHKGEWLTDDLEEYITELQVPVAK